VTDLIPARMLNEVVYCPRLFALEHMNGEWADSADTIRGKTVHRRVDQPSTKGLPEEPSGEDEPVVLRSLDLGDEALGIVAKIDLVEVEGQRVVPVDYKKGKVPNVDEGAWLPERVQVCAQGLLLRAHGYRCDEGVLYFAGSRRRVAVPFTEQLVSETLQALEQARRIVSSGALPPPLFDSPKCHGCSLVGLCLPDEHHAIHGASVRPRTMAPAREEGLPLYVEQRGAKLSVSGEEIVVKVDGKVAERARILDTSRVVVTGAVSVTSPALLALAAREVPFCVHSWSGVYLGAFVPASGRNVLGRIAQHRAASDPVRSLELAKSFVVAKIRNHRVFLRRNAEEVSDRALSLLDGYATDAGNAPSLEVLYGVEGIAARTYFESFARMLKERALARGFDFDSRNKRPPKDPVNALLSMAYSFLARELTSIIQGVGLDAWVGFLHQPRPGKPALSLDLMEEFRPVIAESVVLSALNMAVIAPDDFEIYKTGVVLRDAGRKRFIKAFERRLAEEATHPEFGTRLSYRRVLEVQVRLLGKAVLGEIPTYPAFRIR
jgi:CRISPR-associated protein Cas1